MTTSSGHDVDREQLEAALADAEDAGGGGMLQGLAGRLGRRASVRAVFGEPITQGSTTIIPVAKIGYGLGGGGGSGNDDEGGSGTGWGGGGGLSAKPVGYVVIGDGQAEFRPIRDPADLWPVLLAGAVATWIVFRALRGLFR